MYVRCNVGGPWLVIEGVKQQVNEKHNTKSLQKEVLLHAHTIQQSSQVIRRKV